jgi:hypothetical protein
MSIAALPEARRLGALVYRVESLLLHGKGPLKPFWLCRTGKHCKQNDALKCVEVDLSVLVAKQIVANTP